MISYSIHIVDTVFPSLYRYSIDILGFDEVFSDLSMDMNYLDLGEYYKNYYTCIYMGSYIIYRPHDVRL